MADSNSAILSKAMRDLLTRWERTETAWRDQARSDFEAEYIEELKPTVKAALDAMGSISDLLDQARRECR
jgi:hypothetical protein